MITNSGTASFPLTCGEFVQGTYQGVPALISCPIDRFHTARVIVSDQMNWQIPEDSPKVQQAVKLLQEKAGHAEQGGVIHLISPMPRERGYGTSTADIAASLYAYSSATGYQLTAEEAADIALKIEPTDSTIVSGISLFAYRTGDFWEQIGDAPPFQILILDPGGGINTIHYNQIDFTEKLQQLARDHQAAFDQFLKGLSQGDWEKAAAAATRSAVLHQNILPNRYLDLALDLAHSTGALGVLRAHSGTILGLIYGPDQVDLSDQRSLISRRIPSELNLTLARCVSGGRSSQIT